MVVTGGEPTLQRNLGKFLTLASLRGYRTQIESNGVLAIDQSPTFAWPDDAFLVVSPKVNERTRKYLCPHPRTLMRAQALKFLVSITDEGYRDLPDFAFEKGMPPVYISPMAVYNRTPTTYAKGNSIVERNLNERISIWEPGLFDLVKTRANYEYAAKLALMYDMQLSLQMHLFASLP